MWDQLNTETVHLLYLAIGGCLCLFMLFSSFIKERLYFGEANVAILVGAILGPFAAKAVNPNVWADFDMVVLEFSRVVLIVQCFAVALELPRSYIERHWKSLLWLLGPVVLYGWMICSMFVWWMVPSLSWRQSMAIASCFNAIDPVLATTVVGRSKFAKRIPKHIRDLLLAESASNDVTTSVCLGFTILLTRFPGTARQMAQSLFLYTIIYQVILAGVIGLVIGRAAQYALNYAHKHESTDRQSYLVFYLMVALFWVGLGSILGVDDVLLAFCAGYTFDKEGRFRIESGEAHVSSSIDLLLNFTFFVFLGSMIPWPSFNQPDFGITVWRLVVITLFIFLFRRIPIIMILKPSIPDIRTWREALFYAHFGPIGVGAIFSAALISSEPGITGVAGNLLAASPDDPMQTCLWPIVTFVVFCSSIVHGSSIPLFILGKHINTLVLRLTLSIESETGSWRDRLPRIHAQLRSIASTRSDDARSFTDAVQSNHSLELKALRNVVRRHSDSDLQHHSKPHEMDYSRQLRSSILQLPIYPSWSEHDKNILKNLETVSAGPSSSNMLFDSSLRYNALELQPYFTEMKTQKNTLQNTYLLQAESDHIFRYARPHTAYQVRNTIMVEHEKKKIIKSYNAPPPAPRRAKYVSCIRQLVHRNKRMTKNEFLKELQRLDPEADMRIEPSEERWKATEAQPRRTRGAETRRTTYEDGDTTIGWSRQKLDPSFIDDVGAETAVERTRRQAALGLSGQFDLSACESAIAGSDLKLVIESEDEMVLTNFDVENAKASDGLKQLGEPHGSTLLTNTQSQQGRPKSYSRMFIPKVIVASPEDEDARNDMYIGFENVHGSDFEIMGEERASKDKGKGKRVSLDL